MCACSYFLVKVMWPFPERAVLFPVLLLSKTDNSGTSHCTRDVLSFCGTDTHFPLRMCLCACVCGEP